MNSISKSLQRFQLARIVAFLLLLVLLAIGAMPGYFQGKWPWKREPKVQTLKELRSLHKQGFEITGWRIANHESVTLAKHKWLVQELQPPSVSSSAAADRPPIVMLALAQQNQTHQPQVEWMDLKGSQQWKTDSLERVQLTIPPAKGISTSTQVTAQFLRAWNERQTFATLQWYAWPGGGDPSPDRWFWLDQAAQLQNRRLPWVAVSLLIPIEPLGEIKTVWPTAESLAQKVQLSLMAGPLRSSS
ncbi:MAG: cyanoexosortase B system-associated protein [Leptolyngbyaceae cyanobacterium bins.59]|nr:cyanoexosortase B system-associated protein [Leptolyngbyaceae cyanobacterium bins.59]